MRLATGTLSRLWKNEYFKTTIVIILIVVIVFGFWYFFQFVQNTQYPALAVASGSMCNLPESYCDGWSHPFDRTLHVGDLIIVQGVNPKDIKTAPYPDGDIIIFRRPGIVDELIVHRAIESETVDGKRYFKTKGDGNPSPDSYFGEGTWDGMISEDFVIGKVVMRIPWLGHLALFMHNSYGIYIVVTLLIIMIVIEFILPALSSKETQTEPKEHMEKVPET